MPAMTSYLEKKLLDHSLGLAAYTMPTTVYLSLHTASPTVVGSLTNEITTVSSGYARINITALMNVTDPVTGISTNNASILFGAALVDWGTVSYVAISDDPVAGNMLFFGALTEVQTTPVGESVLFAPSQFMAQLT